MRAFSVLPPAGRALALSAALALSGHAHVTLASPEGGERLQGGSAFTIVWDADDHNCVYNLYFSPDSGKTWSVIALDIDKEVRTHKWTVPEVTTDLGIIRILQDNLTGTDLDDRSPAFHIQASSPVRKERPGRDGMRLQVLPDRLDFSFAADAPGEAVVEAFDPAGRLAATLLRERVGTGNHRFTMTLADLPSQGIIFKARIGGRVLVRGRSPARP